MPPHLCNEHDAMRLLTSWEKPRGAGKPSALTTHNSGHPVGYPLLSAEGRFAVVT
jgi:hypothetical protein